MKLTQDELFSFFKSEHLLKAQECQLSTKIYVMKYFMFVPIFGSLSHILARFSSCAFNKAERRRGFVCPSVNQSVYKLTLKEAYRFKIWYRNIEEGLWEDLEVIFLKIDLDFLEWF